VVAARPADEDRRTLQVLEAVVAVAAVCRAAAGVRADGVVAVAAVDGVAHRAAVERVVAEPAVHRRRQRIEYSSEVHGDGVIAVEQNPYPGAPPAVLSILLSRVTESTPLVPV
jgi:hypothetical protein